MGLETVSTGEVRVWRPDADEVLAIRRGGWSYDELVEYADTMRDEIAAAAEDSPLPPHPDRDAIDALCQRVVTSYVFE